MTDTEQLKYAAKAHGYIDDANTPDTTEAKYGLHKGVDGCFYVVNAHGLTGWSPRTDDGQAFELAMRADITVRQIYPYVYAIGKTQHEARFDNADDMMGAAREAVVLAAAEIGKGMQ